MRRDEPKGGPENRCPPAVAGAGQFPSSAGAAPAGSARSRSTRAAPGLRPGTLDNQKFMKLLNCSVHFRPVNVAFSGTLHIKFEFWKHQTRVPCQELAHGRRAHGPRSKARPGAGRRTPQVERREVSVPIAKGRGTPRKRSGRASQARPGGPRKPPRFSALHPLTFEGDVQTPDAKRAAGTTSRTTPSSQGPRHDQDQFCPPPAANEPCAIGPTS